MKRILLLIAVVVFKTNLLSAQIPDGATAPDFTFTDIDGNTQNLYAYLNAGKYVAIDVSATWCNPCWNYHTSGVMDSLYVLHDIPGDPMVQQVPRLAGARHAAPEPLFIRLLAHHPAQDRRPHPHRGNGDERGDGDRPPLVTATGILPCQKDR